MTEKDNLADDVTHKSHIRRVRQLQFHQQVGFSSGDNAPCLSLENISGIQIRHFSFTTQKCLCRQEVDRRHTLADRRFFPQNINIKLNRAYTPRQFIVQLLAHRLY